MTAHVSKEQLGLMLPGTMSHYHQDEPEYMEPARPGPLDGILAAVSAWFARQGAVDEVAGLTDGQLADIGITRADVKQAFVPADCLRRDHDRMVTALQAGRVASI